MGIYKQGVFGPYSGRVGNVIGTFWKGRCIMRIRAASYTDANTIPQQTQRMKWKLISAFLKANEKLIRIGFAAADATITAFNSALRTNMASAISGVFPTLSLDATKVKLSTGNLLGLETGAVTSTTPGVVKIDWDDNSNNEDAFMSDKLMVSLIDDISGEVLMSGTDVARSAGTASITVPAGWSGRQVHVHAFMKKAVDKVTSQDHVSESEYLGSVAIA